MSDAIKERIEWFEKTLKDLRRNPVVHDLYYFGYCPKCNDITEIRFSRDSDSWAQNPPTFIVCKRCGLSSLKEIKCTGNEIPPKFKKKWDKMSSRAGQIKRHKEKMREFLVSLDMDWQLRKIVYEEAQRRLGRLAGIQK